MSDGLESDAKGCGKRITVSPLAKENGLLPGNKCCLTSKCNFPVWQQSVGSALKTKWLCEIQGKDIISRHLHRKMHSGWQTCSFLRIWNAVFDCSSDRVVTPKYSTFHLVSFYLSLYFCSSLLFEMFFFGGGVVTEGSEVQRLVGTSSLYLCIAVKMKNVYAFAGSF